MVDKSFSLLPFSNCKYNMLFYVFRGITCVLSCNFLCQSLACSFIPTGYHVAFREDCVRRRPRVSWDHQVVGEYSYFDRRSVAAAVKGIERDFSLSLRDTEATAEGAGRHLSPPHPPLQKRVALALYNLANPCDYKTIADLFRGGGGVCLPLCARVLRSSQQSTSNCSLSWHQTTLSSRKRQTFPSHAWDSSVYWRTRKCAHCNHQTTTPPDWATKERRLSWLSYYKQLWTAKACSGIWAWAAQHGWMIPAEQELFNTQTSQALSVGQRAFERLKSRWSYPSQRNDCARGRLCSCGLWKI